MTNHDERLENLTSTIRDQEMPIPSSDHRPVNRDQLAAAIREFADANTLLVKRLDWVLVGMAFVVLSSLISAAWNYRTSRENAAQSAAVREAVDRRGQRLDEHARMLQETLDAVNALSLAVAKATEADVDGDSGQEAEKAIADAVVKSLQAKLRMSKAEQRVKITRDIQQAQRKARALE